MRKEYECPKCGEWIAILDSSPESFACPWCNVDLLYSADFSFEEGTWRDCSTLSMKEAKISG